MCFFKYDVLNILHITSLYKRNKVCTSSITILAVRLQMKEILCTVCIGSYALYIEQ